MSDSLIRLSSECKWDLKRGSLLINNCYIRLSISQKRLLAFLVKNINKPVQNTDIFYEIHDSLDKEFNEKSVRNFISGVRKLAPCLNLANIYGGYYVLKNEHAVQEMEFKEHLFDMLEQSKNAIVITDPNKYDNPIVYVNSAFSELFGYTYEEAIGRNCRFLNNGDRNQDALKQIREAINEAKPVEVYLRDYTKEGEVIFDDVTISPIFDKDKKKLIYFLGIHKNITSIKQFLEKLEGIV